MKSKPESGWQNDWRGLLLAAAAAFFTYFCMYAFRKPFTAATLDQTTWGGLGLKSVLVVSQLLGYMLSKFIGIRVVSELPAHRRALGILLLIGIAELALIGFAVLPTSGKIVMMFINGLPLGMVFGLVLGYLEGRRQTEALSAALCASFIVSSGVVKSIGAWIIQDYGISEFVMPALVGLLFTPPLLLSVWLLQKTPPPDQDDQRLRGRRHVMTRRERGEFVRAYLPGLGLLAYVYAVLTMVRTLRDDFAVEIWRDMGVNHTPSIFATTEILVAVVVIVANSLMIWLRSNLAALRVAVGLMTMAFSLTIGAVWLLRHSMVTPLAFMITCGVGLYVPYVAFHTCVFERLIAALKKPANLGFLMYLIDSIGYLGYAALIVWKTSAEPTREILPFFEWTMLWAATSSAFALLAALMYFQIKINQPDTPEYQFDSNV
ncbi:MAG: hypothetical protein KF752_10885 [Pirellulaceae bacterium]|nr:hypothetical protein [Pirellulaceae bacterium]